MNLYYDSMHFWFWSLLNLIRHILVNLSYTYCILIQNIKSKNKIELSYVFIQDTNNYENFQSF